MVDLPERSGQKKQLSEIISEKSVKKKMEYLRQYVPEIELKDIPDSMREEFQLPHKRRRIKVIDREVARRRYQKQFGISIDDVERIYAEQHGLCAICHRAIALPYKAQKSKLPVLHVDFDYDTQNIRGILCSNCNLALGYIDGNLERARDMVEYLDKYQEQ